MLADMTDWTDLSARASFASHRLIGWIYWDPGAIERYTALGVPDGFGYYVASRGAPLAPAGHQAVAAAFYSIHLGFIELCLAAAAQHTSFEDIIEARDLAVGEGLRTYAPDICDGLAAMGPALWQAADELPVSGRVLFAAHRQRPRPDDPVVSAWLAVNCIREWRGDTHFAVLAAHDLSGTQAGILHNAHLNYPEQWIPRSRGADDDALSLAMAGLEERGLAEDGRVNDAGLSLRAEIETTTDRLCERAWRLLGATGTQEYLDLVEPVGEELLARIDQTAGENWMPAARERRS
jgi:hypothetical protein